MLASRFRSFCAALSEAVRKSVGRRKRLPHKNASPGAPKWDRRFRLSTRRSQRFFHSFSLAKRFGDTGLVRLAAATLLAGLAWFAIPACAAAPTCNLVPGWTQHGNARSYAADNLFEYMDGNAEAYLLYGFVGIQGVNCERGGVTLVIDISEFGDSDSAFGMFSANRDPDKPSANLGMGGQIVPRHAAFAKGRYYVEIAANPEGDHTAALRQWTAALEKMVEGSSTPPAALAWFPAERQQSLRLIPESVLGIGLLKRGYVAQYDFGKAFVVVEESPATAAAVMDKLRARFASAIPVKIGDEAFQATDQYLGRLCIYRKGRYISGYASVAGGQDAAALATTLAARIPAR
ncbi:MAG: DUF6599 family protein [Bryobacteraceae bacterium]|jgi:hypothetical protein